MPEFRPSERTIDLASLGPEAAEALKAVFSGDERVILECDGKVVAAVVPKDDLMKVRRADRLQQERLEPFLMISRKFADVPAEEVEAEVRKALIKVRTEMYGEPYKPNWD